MTDIFTICNNIKDDGLNLASNIPKFHTVEYEISGVYKKISDIDNISDDDIKYIIRNSHNMILNYDTFLSNLENRMYAQKLFTNKRFLINFLSVIKLIKLDQHEIVCLNKLAYDYYIIPDKDKEISDLLYRLTTEVNYMEVSVLSGIIGLGPAQVLAMIRKSSFKLEKCISRVNRFLVKSNLDISTQNVIDIFCFIYERFGTVFIHSMIESKTPDLTPEEQKRFDCISLAILEILNSLSINDIKKVLCDYYFILNMVNQNRYVRFSLKTANGYPRIIKAIRELEITDNITIP